MILGICLYNRAIFHYKTARFFMLNYIIKYNLIEIVFLILTFNCFKCNNYSVATMADVAQLVRALVCGTRCREFESLHPPHIKKTRHTASFLFYILY